MATQKQDEEFEQMLALTMELLPTTKVFVNELRIYRDATVYSSIELDRERSADTPRVLRSLAQHAESSDRPLTYLAEEHNAMVTMRRILDHYRKGIYTQQEVADEFAALLDSTN